MKIAIIGGGIIGFCCGVQIKENILNADVTILSDFFTPNTTGDGSAGLWGPYLMGETPNDKVHKWSMQMHTFLKKIWLSNNGGEAGVCLIPVVRLTSADSDMNDFWKDIVYGCTKIKKLELDAYSKLRGKKFLSGLQFVTYTSEPLKLLPYLEKKYKTLSGKLILKKVTDFDEFVRNSEYDIVINCAGLGARCLVNDNLVHPIRGQVTRVKAGWINHVILDESDDGNYIIPNVDTIVLGGTHQENCYNLDVCPEDKQFIESGCRQFIPGLQNSKHIKDWVGLRPGRKQVRLESFTTGNNKIVIHNYGHGGCGVTLAWGCAAEVVQIISRAGKSKFVDTIVLGGTHQENCYNLDVCPEDKQFIESGCRQFIAGLQNSKHIKDWVGLRPGRKQVRLESFTTGNNKIVIHNYGHGGCGVTLAWGCAAEVVQIISRAEKSKL